MTTQEKADALQITTAQLESARDIERNRLKGLTDKTKPWTYEKVCSLLGMSVERTTNYNVVVLKDAINAAIKEASNWSNHANQ
jgi:hypothetical protein